MLSCGSLSRCGSLHKSLCRMMSRSFSIVLRDSDAVSARAAVGLKRIGVDKVWVLEGGLKAWREHGFPVSQSPEVPEVVAERLGVRLPEP